jgi:tetratricopeptide (TPR) repeat protein
MPIFLAALLTLAGCQRTPPLPAVDTSAFPDAVRHAINEARDAAREQPQDAVRTLRLGMTMQTHGQMQAALACYERAFALDAGRFDTLYYWGFALAESGQAEAAAQRLRQALGVKPDSLPVALKLAEVTRDAALAQDLARRYPKEATAHYLVGRASSGEAAIAAYRRALALFPRYGAAQFALAAEYRKAGQATTELLRNYERDKSAVPQLDDPEGLALAELSVSAPGLLRRAERANNAGQLDVALALHEQALRQDPSLADAWINLISIHARRNQPDAAAHAYAQAVKLAPARPDVHYNFGVFCQQQQRWAEARAAFLKTVSLDPRHADAYLNLGSLAGQQKNFDEAAAAFRHAIAARPDYAEAHYNLGLLHAFRRNFPAARTALQKAREHAMPPFAAAIERDLARLP